MEAELRPSFRIEKIAPVEDDRSCHSLFHESRDRHFANSAHSVAMTSASAPSTASRAEFCELALCESLHFARLFHSLRIVGSDLRSFAQHLGDEIDRDRGTNVVGVRFKGQAPDRDFLVPQDPERFAHHFEEPLLLRRIDPLHFLQQIERHAELFADRDEGGDVFRETGAAVADAGVEKIAPDAPIHADAVRHFLDIGAARFADRGDGVDVGNLEREKGIGGVLDQLRAVDVGHQNRRHEWLVNLLHQIDRALALRADHDPVGLHQVGTAQPSRRNSGLLTTSNSAPCLL